jgi:hypothetical protein
MTREEPPPLPHKAPVRRWPRLPAAAAAAAALALAGVGVAAALPAMGQGAVAVGAPDLQRHLEPVVSGIAEAGRSLGARASHLAARLPMPSRPLVALPAPQASPLEVRPVAVSRAGGLVDVAAVIRNPTAVSQPIPAIDLLLVGADGRPVGRQQLRLRDARLGPGERRELTVAARDDRGAAAGVALRLRPGGIARP